VSVGVSAPSHDADAGTVCGVRKRARESGFQIYQHDVPARRNSLSTGGIDPVEALQGPLSPVSAWVGTRWMGTCGYSTLMRPGHSHGAHTAQDTAPDFIQNLLDSGMLVEVTKFSKFLSAVSILHHDTVSTLPHWMNDEAIKQLLPSFIDSPKQDDAIFSLSRASGENPPSSHDPRNAELQP
jgi:hypothetical protein